METKLKQWSGKFLQDHELKTKRLVLKLPHVRNAKQMFDLVQDPDVPKFMSFDCPAKVEHTKAHIAQRRARCRKRESFELAIWLVGTNRLIGSVGVMNISTKDRKAELGYWLGKEYWGNGYMPEAVMALSAFAFKHLGIHKLIIKVFDENTASQRVAEKCGFVFEGLLKNHIFAKDAYWDVRYYSKLRS